MASKQMLCAFVAAVCVLGLFSYALLQQRSDGGGTKKKTSSSRLSAEISKLQKKLSSKDTELRDCLKNKPQQGQVEIRNQDTKSKEKRVVSFGLYGDNPRYTKGALHNAELVKYILPGWVCRFYIDDTVPQDAVKDLKDEGAEIVKITDLKGSTAGMFWRFLVADDDTVDRYIIRDADSRLSNREATALAEWIESGKAFHVMRDHPNHNFVMNGGLWGGTKGALGIKMKDLITQWSRKDAYLADMEFLQSSIWPRIQNDQIAHDAYHCERYPNTRPFPIRRVNLEIVGGVFDENDEPRSGDKRLFTTTPVKCRGKPSWTYS
jgi:hypothetical protein